MYIHTLIKIPERYCRVSAHRKIGHRSIKKIRGKILKMRKMRKWSALLVLLISFSCRLSSSSSLLRFGASYDVPTQRRLGIPCGSIGPGVGLLRLRGAGDMMDAPVVDTRPPVLRWVTILPVGELSAP